MSINYTISSKVVDITRDSPKPTDSFLVDTNVWYWLTYTKASMRPQSSYYTSYIPKVLNSRARLYWCGLSLSELAHLIEKTEREIYNITNQLDMKPKEYRHLPRERQNVVSEINTSWSQVKAMADPLPTFVINTKTCDNALTLMNSQYLDGYDLFIVESMISQNNVLNIITDDGDYTSVPGITVFTANQNVIRAAKKQGKFIVR
jgi:predicted nucleic acid-binding protein